MGDCVYYQKNLEILKFSLSSDSKRNCDVKLYSKMKWALHIIIYVLCSKSQKGAKWPKLRPTENFYMPLECAGVKYGCAESAQNHVFHTSVHFLLPKPSLSKKKIII